MSENVSGSVLAAVSVDMFKGGKKAADAVLCSSNDPCPNY